MKKKTVASVTSIEDGRKAPKNPEPEPPTPCVAKRLSSNFMTRRTFCGLLFGMGQPIKTAMRNASISSEAATEEIVRLGYDQWARETGRKAA